MDELIARLEKATGPDRELDFDISMFLNQPFGAWESFQKYNAAFPEYTRRDAQPYTASIDAALTLVPEGWRWLKFGRYDSGSAGCFLDAVDTCGATPAIALCIAALRARALAASEGRGT